MNRHPLISGILSVLIVGLLGTGCGSDVDESIDQTSITPGAPPPAQPTSVKEQVHEAVTATQKAAESLHQEFAARMREQMTAMRQSLDELGREVEHASADAKAEAREKYQVLQKKWETLDDHLARLTEATGDSWDQIRTEFEQAAEDLRKTFHDTRQWLGSQRSD